LDCTGELQFGVGVVAPPFVIMTGTGCRLLGGTGATPENYSSLKWETSNGKRDEARRDGEARDVLKTGFLPV